MQLPKRLRHGSKVFAATSVALLCVQLGNEFVGQRAGVMAARRVELDQIRREPLGFPDTALALIASRSPRTTIIRKHASNPEKKPPAVPIIETSVPMPILVGTMVSSTNSSAVLIIGGASPKTLGVGDTCSGYTVASITRGAIELKRDGKLVQIQLKK